MVTKGATVELQETHEDLRSGFNQAGNATLSSGSKWVTFPKAYSDSPYVTATVLDQPIDSNLFDIGVGSITTGSCIVVGSGTSTASFNWLSIGSCSW